MTDIKVKVPFQLSNHNDLKGIKGSGNQHLSSAEQSWVANNHESFQALYTSQSLADAATISWDISQGAIASVSIAGNNTVDTPTNPVVGYWRLRITTNGNDPQFHSDYKFPNDSPPDNSGGNYSVISVHCFYDGNVIEATWEPDM